MSNDAARAEMQRWIGRIRQLPGLARRAAPQIAKELQATLVGNFAAQRSPDGTPWQPAADGREMFQSAPGSLQTTAKGTVIESVLRGPNLHRHHIGIARGKIRRPMLPTKTLPQPVTEAIEKVLGEEFQKLMSGKDG